MCSTHAQVGELGVVSFGGSGGAMPLHPLERPFTDADGVRVMSQVGGSRGQLNGDCEWWQYCSLSQPSGAAA